MTRLRPHDSPDAREAHEVRQQAFGPWLWAGLGLVLVVGFVVLLFALDPQLRPAPQVSAPSKTAPQAPD